MYIFYLSLNIVCTLPLSFCATIFFNSLRGLPIICCGFVPGGFVILGGSLVMLPSDVVLPRTFWNKAQIVKFIDEQHQQRKRSRWEVMDFLRRQSTCVDPINAFNPKSEFYQLAETLHPMFEMEKEGSRHFLEFDKLKPFCQTGNILSLEKLPLRTLQALAKGHGHGLNIVLRHQNEILEHKIRF